jgi:hypothetical protein
MTMRKWGTVLRPQVYRTIKFERLMAKAIGA